MTDSLAKLGTVVPGNITDEQLDVLYNHVLEARKSINPTMTEDTFVNYFLPVLAGKVDDPERMRQYIMGSGTFSPNVGVNVVNNKGKFLFEVPPYFTTDHIKPLPDDVNAITFTEIVNNVSMLHHRSPVQAQALLQSATLQRLAIAHVRTFQKTEDEQAWLEIFKRYGYAVTQPEVVSEKNKSIVDPATGTMPDSTGSNDDVQLSGEF